MARNEIASVETTETGIVFNFGANGTLACTVDQIPQHIRTRLMLHGLRQKVGDSYAGASAEAEKNGGTPGELAKQWASETFATLVAGEWSDKRAAGEGSISLLAAALAQMRGVEVARAIEFLNGKSKEDRQALRSNPKVAAVIAAITAARKQAVADAAAVPTVDPLADLV